LLDAELERRSRLRSTSTPCALTRAVPRPVKVQVTAELFQSWLRKLMPMTPMITQLWNSRAAGVSTWCLNRLRIILNSKPAPNAPAATSARPASSVSVSIARYFTASRLRLPYAGMVALAQFPIATCSELVQL
jgi:hypothetical protein